MGRTIKWFIQLLKTARRFEQQITMLKAVTKRANTKKVRITEDQLKILIACGIIGINTDKQIHELAGTEKLYERLMKIEKYKNL